MYAEKIIYIFAFTVLSATVSAQNTDPKTKSEYSEVMRQCYTDDLKAKWKTFEFTYQHEGIDKKGKKDISMSAKYSEDGKTWSIAPSCHPLAPVILTESYLKNIGKYGNDFKSIVLVLKSSGDSSVQINGAPVNK